MSMSQFLRNVLKLLSAAMIGQLIGFITIPIISRLYSPFDFGIYELFVSLVIIIGSFACFSYHHAIFLPKEEDEAARIVFLCILLIFITSGIATLILFFLRDWIAIIFDIRSLSKFFLFMPVAICFYSLAYVLANWSSRRRKYNNIAIANASSSILNKVFSLLFGIIQPSPMGLIGGSMTNDGVLSIFMLYGLRSDLHVWKKNSWKKIKELAIRYKDFPLYSFPSSLANEISYYITPFFLAFFFGPIVVGLYSLASMITRIPSRLAGNAIYQVFFQSAAEEKRKTGKVQRTVDEVYKRMISLGVLPVLLILIGGEDIFNFFLGAEWYDAGIYAKILIPYTFVTFITLPLNSIFSILEKQKIGFTFNLSLLISRVSALMIGGWSGDIILTLILYSATGFFFWTWKNLYIVYLSEIAIGKTAKDNLKSIIIGLFFVVPVAALKYFLITDYIFIISCVIIFIFYYLYYFSKDEKLNSFLRSFIDTLKRT
ncbi:MAG: lipopolysaccharide biosynthesis protein [Methanomicrobiales archaeon]|nr:lipopolysaccharide biosynthesis protein [Methanomicrobiales archaeon]